MSLDNPYTIKFFVGAPNDVSIMSTQSDKSPAVIDLTDRSNVRYTLQVIPMRFNDKVVHKISMHYKDMGVDHKIVFEPWPPHERLKLRERDTYFTLSFEQKSHFHIFTFPIGQFKKFMTWKQDYVDNDEKLKESIDILFPR